MADFPTREAFVWYGLEQLLELPHGCYEDCPMCYNPLAIGASIGTNENIIETAIKDTTQHSAKDAIEESVNVDADQKDATITPIDHKNQAEDRRFIENLSNVSPYLLRESVRR
ncbi:hypothetical protein N0V90_008430 [Kalmusia sp. IMI 367209]|nr:hypothetical protein N0V90_008430 [Kalmusia sp. IMI 367209]